MKIVICVLALATASASAEDLRPFTATYIVTWKGINVGSSSLTLAAQADGTWLYQSRNVARGLARLALPGDITQKSEFRIVQDVVVPLHYAGDDGTSATKRDIDIRFDWETHRVTGIYETKHIDMEIEAGVYDDLTVQIALMNAQLHGQIPKQFRLVDRDEIKNYEYTLEATTTLQTALGSEEVVVYRTRRPGAAHSTLFWCAQRLGYLPVKVERRDRAENVEWSMNVRQASRE